MAKGKSTLSARHACNKRELAFCRAYAGANFDPDFGVEAYIRSHYPDALQDDGSWEQHAKLPDRQQLRRATQKLLEKKHVQDFLKELRAGPSVRSRDVLNEQAHFGTEAGQMRAATKILEEEDKLGLRDATAQYAEIMVAAGVEVIVPVPGKGEVTFPLGELFPQFKDSTPPVEVLRKTIASLEELKQKREEQDADEAAG